MADVPQLIDRPALARFRARAERAGSGPDFLMRRVVEDVEERLAATLRPFPRALDVASPGRAATDALRGRPQSSTTVRAAFGANDDGGLVYGPEALPIATESFDLAVSCLALHYADDLPGVLAQIRRSLAPDGLFLAAVIGGETLIELRQSFAFAEAEIEGGASPRVMPFADARALGSLLQRAGFALPVVDVDRVTVRYDTPLGLMRDLRAWGASNALAERSRQPLRRATLAAAVEAYAGRFADPDGRVRATFEIVWMSGWAPHANQQKPLKPGSAKSRLADALGVAEGDPGRGK